MQPQVVPCFMMHTFIYSLMQPHVAPYFMMSQCAAGSCLQDILSDKVGAVMGAVDSEGGVAL